MATFVAPGIHRYSSSPRPASRERGHDIRFAAALVSASSIFAFCIHGYHPYAEDGGLYLAGVARLLDPALFPHNTALVMEPARYSLFAAGVAAITRAVHLGLPAALLILHLASIWATLFAAWLLAARCWPDRQARAGVVVLLACWLTLPVAGTALALMDPYLTARSFSTPCILLALVGMLDLSGARAGARLPGLLLLVAALAIAAAFHPLMAAYACTATVMLGSVRFPHPAIRTWATPALTFGFFVAAACIYAGARPESPAYRRIALTRTYWFPVQWSWYELLGLAAPIAILALLAWPTRRQRDRFEPQDAATSLYRMAIAAGAPAFLAAACFARVAGSNYMIARLQPLRMFQIVYLIMVAALGAILGRLVLSRYVVRWAAALVALGGSMFVADRRAFSNSPHLEFPRAAAGNPWTEAFRWIGMNTPEDALFALDPDYINAPGEDAQCFRAIARRSTLPDYSKDGGEASIAPDLTDEWTAGQQSQQGLNAALTTDAMRSAALTPFGVSWVVLNAQTQTQLLCPYENAAVKVCRLR